MPEVEVADMNDVMDEVERLQNIAAQARRDLRQDYDLPFEDPRIEVARHLKAVLNSLYFDILALTEDFAREEWWLKRGLAHVRNSEEFSYMMEDYRSAKKAQLLFLSYSLLESGWRRLLRALDPGAANDARDSFSNVYPALFARLREAGWNYERCDPADFLDLCRWSRNTFHNNGHHVHPKGQDKECKWRGETYRFEHGEVADFLNWSLLIPMAEELLHLNKSVMMSEKVGDLEPIGY